MKLRLFYALWPRPEVRDALAAAARPLLDACRGRRVPKRNYHLTLAFLGSVAEDRLPELHAAAARVTFEPCTLRIDRHGYFKGARAAWLGCRQPSPAAAALAENLRAVLAPLGFQPDPRPFRPHLTVLRKCPGCDWEGEIQPVAWPIDGFVLARSETLPTGPVYHVVHRHP
ncbi:RNA 2',3'-cyclic phosphodiesterase [Thioalkalivibrio sp. XN8]|uniref:RNA 2',3'-cyclic phosphodiesterase n=1 Tax=Thioalkalivibrio sp. XN8 TaxID=2712863 RepID=UPI0013ED5D0C|nr:RNA 2',3'-cyclic phosphodiesterase [Thioalkalivibrio sp. XN8]NGP52134.1 RNA 2',3'-cyclic phosphodiesterase [Thioalkalivibrio sp. XN8]